jgi:hypothetical protein
MPSFDGFAFFGALRERDDSDLLHHDAQIRCSFTDEYAGVAGGAQDLRHGDICEASVGAGDLFELDPHVVERRALFVDDDSGNRLRARGGGNQRNPKKQISDGLATIVHI